MTGFPGPHHDCPLCPRLHGFIAEWRGREPAWFNAPVPTFGDQDARLLIVGLAPGLRGANRTGRPFTGDFAGHWLYDNLSTFGFSSGRFDARPDDGLRLTGAAITNAVRCVPPENKPTPEEIATCRPFLEQTLAALPRLKVIIALGKVAHDSVVKAHGLPASRLGFAHGARHGLPNGRTLIDTYHSSRYNANTGRITETMFRAVFEDAARLLATAKQQEETP